MKVLLLGASGLLGHNVLQRLMDEGHSVRALVRRVGAVQLPGQDWEMVVGTPTDRHVLSAAAEGCDAIINCAGVTDMSLLRREAYDEVNVDLCRSLLETMSLQGIKRLVHVSTVNTIGYGSAGHPADETAAMREPFSSSFYAQSKAEGERIVLDAAREHADWHVVVVNPGYMLGPLDVKPSSGRMLLAAYRRRLMFAPRGGKSFVDVRDVAAAVVSALEYGQSGRRYIAVSSRGQFGIKKLYALQAQVEGYRQCIVTLPDWLLLMAGAIGDLVRALGVRTELSTRNVRQLMVSEYYDNRCAVDELRMPETDIALSIRDFYLWRQKQTETI